MINSIIRNAFLSMAASPLVPTALACSDALKRRRLGRFFLVLFPGLFFLGLEIVVAFFIPIHWTHLWITLAVISLCQGTLTSLLMQNDATSSRSNTPPLTIWPAWVLFTIVLLAPFALLISLLVNPNGFLLMFKPGYFRWSLAINLLIGIPLGVFFSATAIRMSSERNSKQLFMFCSAVSLMILVFSAGIFLMIMMEESIGNDGGALQSQMAHYKYLIGVEIGILFVLLPLACIVILMMSLGLKSLLNRAVFCLLLVFCVFTQMMILDNELVFMVREKHANRSLGEKNWSDACRIYRFLETRSPKNVRMPGTLINWSVAALLSDNQADWSHILDSSTRIPEMYIESSANYALREMAARAAPIRSSTLIDLDPVNPEPYLDSNWCAFLSVARKMTGMPSESQLKYRLKQLSPVADQIQVAPLSNLSDLRIAATAYDLEPVLIHPSDIPAAIERGIPVLVCESSRNGNLFWNIIIGAEPSTNTLIFFSTEFYSLVDSAELKQEGVEALITGDSDQIDSDRSDAFWKLISIEYLPSLETRLDRDFGWALILLPAGDPMPDGLTPIAKDRLFDIDRARSACLNRQFTDMLGVLDRYPDQAWSKALRIMSAYVTRPLFTDIVFTSEERDRLLAECARPEFIEALDSWSLLMLTSLIPDTIPLDSRTALTVFRRLSDLESKYSSYFQKYIETAVLLGDEPEAVYATRHYLKTSLHDGESLIQLLGELVRLPCSTPELKSLLSSLIDHFPLIIGDPDSTGFRMTRHFGQYAAARARLSDSPDQRLKWWTRAVEADPDNAVFLKELRAVTLERTPGADVTSLDLRIDTFLLPEESL